MGVQKAVALVYRNNELFCHRNNSAPPKDTFSAGTQRYKYFAVTHNLFAYAGSICIIQTLQTDSFKGRGWREWMFRRCTTYLRLRCCRNNGFVTCKNKRRNDWDAHYTQCRYHTYSRIVYVCGTYNVNIIHLAYWGAQYIRVHTYAEIVCVWDLVDSLERQGCHFKRCKSTVFYHKCMGQQMKHVE